MGLEHFDAFKGLEAGSGNGAGTTDVSGWCDASVLGSSVHLGKPTNSNTRSKVNVTGHSGCKRREEERGGRGGSVMNIIRLATEL